MTHGDAGPGKGQAVGFASGGPLQPKNCRLPLFLGALLLLRLSLLYQPFFTTHHYKPVFWLYLLGTGITTLFAVMYVWPERESRAI